MIRRPVVFSLIVAAPLLFTAGTAAGAATLEAGWWTAAPVAAAPDAPADGLVVQGGSDLEHPLAYAAVEYALVTGEAPQSLTFTVASGSASTPSATLTLCPLTAPLEPAQGGAMGDAPAFDCATKASAAPNANGTIYTFAVDGLAGDGTLGVAILPSAPADRVVLAKPAVDSLTSSGSSTDSPTSEPVPAFESGVGAIDGASTLPAGGATFDIPAIPMPATPPTSTDAARSSAA